MNKTLSIELSDQRKELADAFYREMYTGELMDEHEMSCEFRESPENLCSCLLGFAYDFVKNWGGK